MSTTNLNEYSDKELLTIYDNLQKQMIRVGTEIKKRKSKKTDVKTESAIGGIFSSIFGGESPSVSKTKITIKKASSKEKSSSNDDSDEKPVKITMSHLKSAYKKKTGDNPPSGLSKDELEEEVRKVGALRLAKEIASN